MDTFFQDLRFGARTLVRNPGFACVAVLTLALGVGANAAIFSVVNAVLLRPLPWSEPDRAVMIWSHWTAFDKTWVSDGEVNDYRKETRTLADVGAWDDGQVNLTGDGDPERVSAGTVTANLFSVLGATPIRGRVFTPQEDVPNGPKVAIIGYRLVAAALRRRPDDGRPHDPDQRRALRGRRHHARRLRPADRLSESRPERPVDPERLGQRQHRPRQPRLLRRRAAEAGRHRRAGARRSAHARAANWTRQGLYPAQMQFDTVVLSLREEVVGTVRRAIWLLFGAVGFLLLIACANVANLLLARAEARQREMAVRTALGAGAARVVRQLLTESLVLAGVSAAAGLALAWIGVRLLAWWNPSSIPRVAGDVGGLARAALHRRRRARDHGRLQPRAGRAPAQGGFDRVDEGRQAATPRPAAGARRFRNGLVVAEMALAVVLLVGAGLMLRTLWSLQRIDLGFNPVRRADDEDLAARGRPTRRRSRWSTSTRVLVEQIGTIPGVTAAGAARSLPLGSTIGDFGLARGRLRAADRHQRERRLADRHRRLHAGDRRAGPARPRHRAHRHLRLAVDRLDQRRDGAPLLGRPRSDRRTVRASGCAPIARGSPSSASSRTSGTTA